MVVTVVTADKYPGCFGVYSSDEKAFEAIQLAYGSTVKKVDKANNSVRLENGDVLFLQARRVHD